MKRKLGAVTLAMVISTNIFSSMEKTVSGNESEGYKPTITSSTMDTDEVKFLSGDMLYVTENYQKYIVESYYTGEDLYIPKGVTIDWDAQQVAKYYTFNLSLNEDMTNATSYVLFDNSIYLENLFVAKTYYYQVVAVCEEKVVNRL